MSFWQKAFCRPNGVGQFVWWELSDKHIPHLVCSVNAINTNENHKFYSHLLPIKGKKLWALHNTLNRAAKVLFPFWKKSWESDQYWLPQESWFRFPKQNCGHEKSTCDFSVSSWCCFSSSLSEASLICRLLNSTFKVLTHIIDPKVNTD